MGKCVIFNIPGSIGHFNPTRKLTKELVKHGEEVLYYNSLSLKKRVQSLGAEFKAYNVMDKNKIKVKEKYSDDPWDKFIYGIIERIIISKHHEMYLMTEIGREKPDYIIFDEWTSIFANSISRQLNIPSVCSLTKFAYNDEIIKKYFEIFICEILNLNKEENIENKIRKCVLEISNKYNVDYNDAYYLLSGKGNKNIVHTTRVFQPLGNEFGSEYIFLNPERKQNRKNIAIRKKTIYISLGSVLYDEKFYQFCIEMFKNTKFEIIINISDKIERDKFFNVPPNISLYQYVDQEEILQRCDLFITHGGMNSVNEAISYLVPMIVYPIEGDQFLVCKRVEELGVGRRMEKYDNYTRRRFLEMVQDVIEDDKIIFNLQVVQESFEQETSVQELVKKIKSGI